MVKTDKSKAVDVLTKDLDDSRLPPDSDTLVIEDGNACFYYLKEVPSTFQGIADRIFSCLCKTSDVVFSIDMYLANSVKEAERRRGCGEKLIIKSEKTKKPRDWKEFLTNDENKRQLVDILLSTWSSDSKAASLQERSVTLIAEGKAYQLSSSDREETTVTELATLCSTQEETDSRIILYCLYAKEAGYKFVRVRSPDSDVFFILVYHASQLKDFTVLFETGKGNNRRCLDIGEFANSLTPALRSSLLSLYAFTGCDSCSAFKGKGKVAPIKLLKKSVHFQEVFCKLGESQEVPADVPGVLEEFVCTMYGNARVKCVNDLQHTKLLTKCASKRGSRPNPKKNFDMGSLCLQEHIKWVNFQVWIWRQAHIPDPALPDPTDGHGWTVENGVMEPK